MIFEIDLSTSVAELNREGALLTDEVDLENVDASKVSTIETT